MTNEKSPIDPIKSDDLRGTHRSHLLARRNFLKGTSLALPAVMTLTPGTVQAMVSITCAQRALDSDLTTECLLMPPGNTDDGYFRLPVSMHDQMVEVTNEQGQPETVPNNVPTYFLGVDDGEPVWRSCANGAIFGPEPPEDCNLAPNLLYPTGYAVVHVHVENGEIVAVGSPTNPANAFITSAAGACMASIVAHAP